MVPLEVEIRLKKSMSASGQRRLPVQNHDWLRRSIRDARVSFWGPAYVRRFQLFRWI